MSKLVVIIEIKNILKNYIIFFIKFEKLITFFLIHVSCKPEQKEYNSSRLRYEKTWLQSLQFYLINTFSRTFHISIKHIVKQIFEENQNHFIISKDMLNQSFVYKLLG